MTNPPAQHTNCDEQYFPIACPPEVRSSSPRAIRADSTFQHWVADLGSPDGTDLAPATVHRVVQLMNKCVNAAVEDRLISANPVANLPLPRIERKEMRFLTHDQVWTLADTIDGRYRGFVLLGGFAGLRLGEMLRSSLEDVDFLRRSVQVSETLASTSPATFTTGHRRPRRR